MDDQFDDDIRRAIELSLQESAAPRTQPPKHEVIELDEDEENDPIDEEERRFRAEMELAMKMSTQEPVPTASSSKPTPAHVPAAVPSSRLAGVGALTPAERKKMEEERLARLKRTRPDLHRAASTIDLDDSDEEEADMDIDEAEQARGAKRQHISRPSDPRARRANTHASVLSRSAASTNRNTAAGAARSAAGRAGAGPSTQTGLFWDGELRQTGNQLVDPGKSTQPDFRLTDIISPNEEIEFAIVSAYCWDFPFAYRFFAQSTPVIAVDQSGDGEASIKTILPNWIRTTPFIRGGFGCMHMKFMLLFYKDGRLRVVISTANMVEYDWRHIENTVWVQDIPKRAAPVVADPKTEDFASSFVRVLHAVNVAPALINMLRNDHPNLPLQRLEDLRTHWDFSRVRVALIPSVAGKHEGWPKVILSGHTRLMKALLDLDLTPPRGTSLTLECQGSSIGNYTTQWTNEFHCSASGESASGWLDGPKARRARLPWPPVKILFPTGAYVRESRLGEQGGGTMFCRRNQWEGAKFPRELFHQSRSKRGPVLMHSKMILGTFCEKRGTLDSRATNDEEDEDEDTEGQEKHVGWLYVGSHNFTPSAWGTLSGSGFNPTLNITNYELGILIPLRNKEEIERLTCWERPPQKYVLGRDEPWMQTESPLFAQAR